MSYAYYPGCALTATGLPYGMSSMEIARALDLDLPELDDWNCCGATVYQTIDESAALELAGRNLALARKSGAADVVTPCSACFVTLGKANVALAGHPEQRRQVDEALAHEGLEYDGNTKVRHLLDVLVTDVGIDRVAARVTAPFDGLKVACYYGCLLTRPPAVTGASDPENPTGMDRLMVALGAQPLDWSFKTECCGAAFAVSRPDLVSTLSSKIVKDAADVGAEMVVAACPLCQSNLDMYQERDGNEPLPIVYFTELMGVAFGLAPRALGLNKHIQDPAPALCRHNLVLQGRT